MDVLLRKVVADELVWYALGSKGANPDSAFLKWLRSRPCCSCRRYAVPGYLDVVPHHIRRVRFAYDGITERSGRCGTGLKPDFCSVPLCVSCHDKVEGSGSDRVIADEDQWEMWRWFYPALWCGETLLKRMGFRSWPEVNRQTLVEWLAVNVGGCYGTVPG